MKNFDLIDWTMQEARQLTPEHHMPSALDGPRSLNKLLEVLEGEQLKPNMHDAQIASAPRIQLAAENPTGRPSSEVVAGPKPNIVSNLPASVHAAPSTSVDDRVKAPKSALLKAIVEPNIYTARVDRDRAIALRWVLRDIKNNRLKWSPVNQHDLRILIVMGLVEMRDDAPVLTNAGVSAII
jgi:hypothetical protein